jgi:hypothetical protein
MESLAHDVNRIFREQQLASRIEEAAFVAGTDVELADLDLTEYSVKGVHALLEICVLLATRIDQLEAGN